MGRKALLDVLKGAEPWRRPIWLMRQAGRYLPEYRQVREKAGSFLNLCYTPELAIEVTLQPLRRFDLDAAILFSDILVVPHAMGLPVGFVEGEGPKLGVVRNSEDVAKLGHVNAGEIVQRVCDVVRGVRGSLPEHVALIGFCGAPWTVASYMIEGGSSDRERAKIAAFSRAGWFGELIDRLVDASVSYLCAQIGAGAEAVQIFDSWAGDLPGDLRLEYVVSPIARIVGGVRQRYPDIPVIVFGRGLGVDHLRVVEGCRPNAIGVETEQRLGWFVDKVDSGCALQGNLDPVALLAPGDVAVKEAVKVIAEVPMERHIFNLGHGIKPQTDPLTVERVVNGVRDYDRALIGR